MTSFKRFACIITFLLFLFFITIPVDARAAEECLSPDDKKVFMEMYTDIVEKGQIHRIEEVKQFLRTHGCAREMDEAERTAQEIVKGLLK